MASTQVVRRASRTGSFVVAGAASAALLTASAAPSPLYPVYQRMWGFSALTLTVIFAVYVFALMASLITIGSISDRVGRRPLAIGAMVLLLISMVLFCTAGSVAGLVLARIVQGIAVGAATGAIGAMIIDRQPDARSGSMVSAAAPAAGMAVGAVLAGVLVDYAPWPRYLVYVLLAALYLLLAVLLVRLPEDRPAPVAGAVSLGRALLPSVGLPRPVRRGFLAVLPAMSSTWHSAGCTCRWDRRWSARCSTCTATRSPAWCSAPSSAVVPSPARCRPGSPNASATGWDSPGSAVVC